jgi:hypothetical protein
VMDSRFRGNDKFMMVAGLDDGAATPACGGLAVGG